MVKIQKTTIDQIVAVFDDFNSVVLQAKDSTDHVYIILTFEEARKIGNLLLEVADKVEAKQ